MFYIFTELGTRHNPVPSVVVDDGWLAMACGLAWIGIDTEWVNSHCSN